MGTSRKTLIVGGLTVLEAGCLLGVACLGRGLLPVEQAAADAVPSQSQAPRTVSPTVDLDSTASEAALAVDRTSLGEEQRDAEPGSGASATRDPQKESEFYADFLAIAARDPGSFEAAARGALREAGPDCRKVAALRALCDTRSPAANDALAAAVLELPDLSAGDSESVAGFALRRLSLRATEDSGARRALEGLVFGPSRPAPRLRAAAAAALCSTAAEADVWRIAERLRGETDEQVLACAGAALSLNPNVRAAQEARSRLGFSDSLPAEIAKEEE